MGRVVVHIYVTDVDAQGCQREVGTITYGGNTIETVGEVATIVDELMDGVGLEDSTAVVAALRCASVVFDGAYVRASVSEE